MRFVGSVGLLLLLFGCVISSNEADSSSTLEVSLSTSPETITESTVLTTSQATTTIISSTTVGTTTEEQLSCDIELKPTMDILNILNCTGPILFIKNEENKIDISHFNDAQTQKLLQGHEERTLYNSLTVHKSDITTLNLKIRTDTHFIRTYTITDNDKLKILNFNGSLDPAKPPIVIIKGNKQLNEDTINHLETFFEKRNMKESVIQGAHECRMVKRYVETYSYLSGCGYFDGDLELNNMTQGEWPEKLDFSRIEGCLRIKSTDISSFGFFKNLEKPNCLKGRNVITGNKDLCLTSEQVSNLRKQLGELEYNGNSNCTDVCTPQWAFDKRNDANIICHTIEGSIFISGGANSEDYEYLLNTEIVNGHIDVGHNTFANFSFLSNIKKVNSNDRLKPAIYIHENANMNELVLNLVEVHHPNFEGGTLIKIVDNNQNFTFTEEEMEKLRKLGSVAAPFVNPNVHGTHNDTNDANFDEDYSVDNSSDSKINKQKGKDKVVEKDDSVAIGIGTAVGIFVLLVVIVIVIGVVYFKCRKKSKGKEKTQQEKTLKLDKPEAEKKKYTLAFAAAPEVKITKKKMKRENEVTALLTDFEILTQEEKKYFWEQEREFVYEQRLVLDSIYRNSRKEKLSYFYSPSFYDPNSERDTVKAINKIFVYNMKFVSVSTSPTEITHRFPPRSKGFVETSNEFDAVAFVGMILSTHTPKYSLDTTKMAVNFCLDTNNPKLSKFPTKQLAKINGKCTVVGRILGSFYDLKAILSLDTQNLLNDKEQLNTTPMNYSTYVFSGDYMNGTFHDLDVLLALLVWARVSKKVILLRGPNEYNVAYDLLDEAISNKFYDISNSQKKELIDQFLTIFSYFPLGALINGRMLVVHGGISKRLFKGKSNIDEVFEQIPMPLPACDDLPENVSRLVDDILYSKPCSISHPITDSGAGCYFNKRLLDKFRAAMNIDVLVRGRADYGIIIGMNNRLIGLNGHYNFLLAKHGLDRASKKIEVMKVLNLEENRKTLSVLSVKEDGNLTIYLIDHDIPKFYEKYLKMCEELKVNVVKEAEDKCDTEDIRKAVGNIAEGLKELKACLEASNVGYSIEAIRNHEQFEKDLDMYGMQRMHAADAMDHYNCINTSTNYNHQIRTYALYKVLMRGEPPKKISELRWYRDEFLIGYTGAHEDKFNAWHDYWRKYNSAYCTKTLRDDLHAYQGVRKAFALAVRYIIINSRPERFVPCPYPKEDVNDFDNWATYRYVKNRPMEEEDEELHTTRK